MLPDGLPDDEFDDDGDSSESLIVLPDAVDIDAVVGMMMMISCLLDDSCHYRSFGHLLPPDNAQAGLMAGLLAV